MSTPAAQAGVLSLWRQPTPQTTTRCDAARTDARMKYDVQFINPFLEAVMSVLSTMAMVSATPGRPYINTKRTSECDVTGLIGISGHAEGTIALSLSKGAILRIVSNMIGEEYDELNEDIADAVGELTNMISGAARQSLSTQGLVFSASTPSVVIGRGLRVAHPASGPILAIPFSTPDGDLVVEVCFTKSESVSVDSSVQTNPPEEKKQAPTEEPAAQDKMDQNAIDKFFD